MEEWKKIITVILLGVTGVIGLLACLIIWLGVSNNRRLERLREAEERYPEKIEKYLEKKYGGEFHVNPEYEYVGAGSPVPFSPSAGTYTYEAYDREGCALSIELRPISNKDPAIGELYDDYGWKALSIQMEEWFERELADILPEKYKMVRIINGEYLYEYPFTSSTTLEQYLGMEHWNSVLIYIIAPPSGRSEEFTEDNIYPVLEKFHALSGKKINISFRYYCLDSYGQYENIDTKQLQNWYFETKKEENPIEAISQYERMEIELKHE